MFTDFFGEFIKRISFEKFLGISPEFHPKKFLGISQEFHPKKFLRNPPDYTHPPLHGIS